MNASSQLPNTDPRVIAFAAFKASPEYPQAKRWAAEAGIHGAQDGALWTVFVAGMSAVASEAAGPVAWQDPATQDIISAARKADWQVNFGAGGQSKAATYTRPLYAEPASQAGRDAVEARPETPALAYSLDEERYTEDLGEIMMQLAEAENLVEGATYHVGEVVRHAASDFTEGAAEFVLEHAREAAFEAADEWADSFAYPVAQALQDDLDRVIGEWADKHLPVTFWTVANVREVEVTADDVRDYDAAPDAALSTPTGRAGE